MEEGAVKLKLQCLLRRFGLVGVPWQVLACAGVLLLLLVGVALWRFWPSGQVAEGSDFALETAQEESGTQEGTSDTGTGVAVDVEGAVKKPGLYELPSGARVGDAIKAAGGLKKTAARAAVNLAQEVEDGSQIYIPTKSESAKTESDATSAGNAAGSGSSASSSGSSTNGKVNLNTASSEELQTLSGIGEVLAQRIIDYREKNGSFASVEDLKNVSGIGDTRFASLEEYICV